MSATLLANELANLISESKRKNNDLRNAAEKALSDLKSLTVTSEQQLAADLSRRPAFPEPFLIACQTRNARFASSGVVCLQRLVISRSLARARLGEALDAFNACSDLGLDLQLKVLQALPSLVQNYADDLKGDLLASTLQVCSSLQAAKTPTVSGVAAATLQQLVSSVFEKVAAENAHAAEIPPIAEVPGSDGPIAVRPAAHDAYRIFRDLILAAEDRKTRFVDFSSLPTESALELIYSCIETNSYLVKHEAFTGIIRSNVLPFVIQALSEKLVFSVTVRCVRILGTILCKHMARFPGECETALGLIAHGLDSDSAPIWKRTLFMEVLRTFFKDQSLVIAAYMAFDLSTDGKPVVQDILSCFVRLSSEKPAIIGLGQQSTVPTGPSHQRDEIFEQSAIEAAGGMAGVISSALGVVESSVSGISSQWSLPRTACVEQLDKTDAPNLPETYIYSLVLECLNSLSDNLARIVLPLTVQSEPVADEDPQANKQTNADGGGRPSNRMYRSQSFRKRAIPLNPLQLEGSNASKVRAVGNMIESCWPAVLATSSTFLNAALDDTYYRSLIKAYQRFAQVAGLLRLSTPRDALMTTLGKAAVPPQVLNAINTDGLRSPGTESPRVFSNPRSLLSVESLVSQSSSASVDRDRRPSFDPGKPGLTVRNLLCLRALLNLAMALGPTLGEAFAVVVDVLKHADMVLSTASPQQLGRQSSKTADSAAAVQAFSAEVANVEAAASRLLESTNDWPNDAFFIVVETFCRLLHPTPLGGAASPRSDHLSPPATPTAQRRTPSALTGLNTFLEMRSRDYQFVIPKLGTLARLNIPRFVSNDPEHSGWTRLVDELKAVATSNGSPAAARKASTDVLCKLSAQSIMEVAEDDEETKATSQNRAISVLLRLIDGIYAEDGDLTSTDIEIHANVLDALKTILERSGETLLAGWDKTVAIVGSVFESDKTAVSINGSQQTRLDWSHISNEFISPRLAREAFAAVQLVCSDFLGLLPTESVTSIIELLYRFMSQTEDLNLSLTTITMIWNLSDALFDGTDASALEKLGIRLDSGSAMDAQLEPVLGEKKSAQWLLVLLKLRRVIHSGQLETRKAALQTLCSVCANQGVQLSPKSWHILLHTTLVGLVADEAAIEAQDGGRDRGSEASVDMTGALLAGASLVIADHVEVIGQDPHLPELWHMLTAALAELLSRAQPETSASVYKALRDVLARLTPQLNAWKDPIDQTFTLWSQQQYASAQRGAGSSNQLAFVAYTELATELYRLTSAELSDNQLRDLIANLSGCVRASDADYHNADVHAMSPLQSKVLELFRSMRTDLPGCRALLIHSAAEFTTLHHEKAYQAPGSKTPSYAALAGETLEWLPTLLIDSLNNDKTLIADAVQRAIRSLAEISDRKYLVRLDYKGIMLWRRATATAVTLAQPILDYAYAPTTDELVRREMWTQYVRIAGAVVNARGLPEFTDPKRIYEDQNYDIEAIQQLNRVMIPRLGDPNLPASLRSDYAQSLFEASLVHPTEKGELPAEHEKPLARLIEIRRGRVKKVPFSQREQMCYQCLSELISLGSNTTESTIEQRNLAEAAAPLLILRLAIPIRSYIADQPLRGRAPQPLSELEELLYCFEQIGKLELQPGALSETPQSGLKAHLPYLYPLLAKAVRTAGDRWSGADEVLQPLQALLESLDLFT